MRRLASALAVAALLAAAIQFVPTQRWHASDPAEEATAAAAGAQREKTRRKPEPRPSFGGATTMRQDPARLLVRFERGTPRRAARAVLRDAGVKVERQLPKLDVYLVRPPKQERDEALRDLAAASVVDTAERELIVSVAETTPSDAQWEMQIGLRLIRMPAAWDIQRAADGVNVAVLDTGVNAEHPDLAGVVSPGYDLVNGDADASDDHGHGTSVAGVIAARADNGEGVAGVCWLCRILPVKVLGADGTGLTTNVAAGVLWAVDHGADVVNLSLGGPATSAALDGAIAYARSKGVVVIAAAGNAGVTTPFFPGASPGAIGVAATDERDHFYSWSNHGSWVALAAPGCNPTTLLNGYGVLCGTSFAAPVVAGVAALALATNTSADANNVQSALERSAVPVGADVRFGRVDAAGALRLLRPPAAPKPVVRVSSTVSGSVGGLVRSRTHRRSAGAGAVTAILQTPSGRRVELTLLVGSRVAARAIGRRSLRVAATATGGSYAVRVATGRHPVRYKLTLTSVPAVPGAQVRVSEVPNLPAVAQLGPGPYLGRPVVPSGRLEALGAHLTNVEDLEAPIVATLNAHRRQRGLRALRVSAALARAGDAHAAALGLAGAFKHEWPDGRAFATWARGFYQPLRSRPWRVGENLLWAEGGVTPQHALAMWLASPTHRTLLESASWREIGIGVVRIDGAGGVFGGRNVYVVACEFGARG